ncbi:CRISPR-associated helicase, Cas3 family [Methanococcus maripaludis C5]|uniref:CRISPR-associated helicase, Cas3 family n=1 Tax=Methanococcus maripaludis (strain C5 / ATCC BAA-1333) TaxID=402880 RepID=A4FXZ4_METM5|nr:CRISPR-associated helicase/endonuclease Cas3 [Methanococcus maripaludis]ABO35078.1 CRISPR-associated helicase, Cas3 family [Methanococcus maripaludis C5]
MQNLIMSHEKKLLKDHLFNVGKNIENILVKKDLDLKLIDKELLPKLGYLIGIAHDFGKSTSFFQSKLNENKNSEYSHHGLISSIFGYHLLKEYVHNEDFSIISYIAIKNHHGNIKCPLESISSRLEKDLKVQYKDILSRKEEVFKIYETLLLEYQIDLEKVFLNMEITIEDFESFIDDMEDMLDEELESSDAIERFLTCNLLYSVLVDSDKKEAANLSNEYFTDNVESYYDIKEYINNLKQEMAEKFVKNNMNLLRDQFYQDVVENPMISNKCYMYSVNAPTGIGKTLTVLGLANKIKSLNPKSNRIIYCLPYSSIIDQTHGEMENIFKYFIGEEYSKKPTKYLLKHHYLTPLLIKGLDNEEDCNLTQDSDINITYMDQKLLLESWESANIITTFVQFFESIFSNKNSRLKKFHNIINSIVILDEIQTMPAEYYKLIKMVFEILSKRFKTTIIFLTATQPNLACEDSVNLVNTRYFTNNEFDRVELYKINGLTPIDEKQFLDSFEKLFFGNSAIVVCNKINVAIKLYELIRKNEKFSEYSVLSLTTNITPKDRKNRIKKINKMLKGNEKIILVSTQLIEAGVDLSFQYGFRDVAPLDSIIQTSGRVNRSNEYDIGKMYLFNYVGENGRIGSSIYDPKSIQITRELLENDKYMSKDYWGLSNQYYGKYMLSGKSNLLLNSIYNLIYEMKEYNKNKILPVNMFKVITDHKKFDVIISPDETSDLKIKELIKTHEAMIQITEIYGENKMEFGKLSEKYEILKKELNENRVSIYENILNKYSDFTHEFNGLNYILSEDYNKIYDENIGVIALDNCEIKHKTLFS